MQLNSPLITWSQVPPSASSLPSVMSQTLWLNFCRSRKSLILTSSRQLNDDCMKIFVDFSKHLTQFLLCSVLCTSRNSFFHVHVCIGIQSCNILGVDRKSCMHKSFLQSELKNPKKQLTNQAINKPQSNLHCASIWHQFQSCPFVYALMIRILELTTIFRYFVASRKHSSIGETRIMNSLNR